MSKTELNETPAATSKLRNEQIWLAVGSLMILAFIALAAGLAYTQIVLVPFVLAVFLSTVVAPLVDFQVLRLKTPHSLAVLLALVVVVLIIAVLGLLLMVAVQAIIVTAGDYSDSFVELTKNTLGWLKEWKIEIDNARLAKDLQQRLPGIISQAAGTGTSLIVNGFLVIFFVIFLLAGRDSRRLMTGIYQEIETAVRRYILAKFTISAISGLLVWLILAMIGLRPAFVFGLLAFLLNFIPSIGSIIATLLPLPLAVAQFGNDWGPIVAVVAIPGALQMVVGNVIEPKWMGRGLELHPVTVLLALAFWGLLWGCLGMVLAVPITAVIRIVLIHFEITRSIGNLLGGKLPPSASPRPLGEG